jgi:hypothetical protein
MNRASGIGAVCVALVLFVSFISNVSFAAPPLTVRSANNNVQVLQPADILPINAQRIKAVTLNGNNPTGDCSYMQILESAKKMAAEMGANVVKVTNHIARNDVRDCDEVTAVFYNAPDAGHCASEMKWIDGSRLSWNDFRGKMPARAKDETAAATYCGIGFETNTIGENEAPKVFVYNTFYANQSWVRPGEQTPEILAHEQGHFDICELYTRMLREKINAAKLNFHNMKAALASIYSQVNKIYQARQQAYEDETQHGLVAAQQQKWQQEIALELEQSKQWAE